MNKHSRQPMYSQMLNKTKSCNKIALWVANFIFKGFKIIILQLGKVFTAKLTCLLSNEIVINQLAVICPSQIKFINNSISELNLQFLQDIWGKSCNAVLFDSILSWPLLNKLSALYSLDKLFTWIDKCKQKEASTDPYKLSMINTVLVGRRTNPINVWIYSI